MLRIFSDRTSWKMRTTFASVIAQPSKQILLCDDGSVICGRIPV